MAQENFLVDFVEKALEQNGFTHLSQDAKKELIPQFVAQLQQRIGASLLPYLDAKTAEEFTEMLKDKKTTPSVMFAFWERAVPNYQEVVKKEMEIFLEDLKKIAK